MKSVFSLGREGHDLSDPSFFELAVCLNHMPSRVVLELVKVASIGFSGSSGSAESTESRRTEPLMRSMLTHSEARAIASALLSAATEANPRH